MVDGSVIAEIVEAATRAVMQRMFDGAGQQVCGDGRRNYVSPQKASTPSFVRPMPGAFSGPANAQGQSSNTQGRDNRPLSGTKVKWTSNNQQKHVQQQQQQQQHKVTWAAVVAKRRHRNRDIGRAVDTGQCCKAGRADTATRGPASEMSEGNGAQARREQGPRTPAAQQGKGHREPRQKRPPRDTPQQQRASHTRKRHRHPLRRMRWIWRCPATSRSFSIKRNAKR
ncbi:hypothetical protein ERJ75_001284300 [Trypanosoma vivax]|nr:hypothetical protein ERJ75_001284300 [Trypanosoma vivax]